jgi:uncharacterized protein (TIGR03437 family)
MLLEGANPRSTCIAEEPLPGQSNHFIGSRRSEWREGITAFARVRYRDVYPGIDLVFHSRAGVFEYDWIVGPGANPDSIRMHVRGAESVRIEAGDLVLSTAAGEVRWNAPSVYQSTAEMHTAIHGRFALEPRGRVSFRVDPYDRTRELVIDPTLAYSTYLGGTGNEVATAVATDNSGNVYMTGVTTSQTLPVKAAARVAYGGGTTSLVAGDAFVAKFDSKGTLVYLTYLGGSRDDFATALAVDASGNAWVTGGTSSTNFPVTANAYQKTMAGVGGNDVVQLGDAFLAKLGPAGDLQYATYFGGRLDDYASGIALDGSGAIYITGSTHSTDFPVTAAAYQARSHGGGGEPGFPRYGGIPFSAGEAFVAKFNPAGTQLVFSTYLGGAQDDLAMGIAVDAAGSAYVTGSTLSADFPTTAGAYQRVNNGADTFNNIFFNFGDGFITKFSPDGSSLVYSTLLGGRGDDVSASIVVDSSGNAIVTGSTSSQDFPTTAGAYQRSSRGPFIAPVADQLFGDAFVTKLNATGSGLVFSTYLGGTGDDAAFRIALDAGGNIYIAGFTDSPDFPTTRDAVQARFGGGGMQNEHQDFGDAFLVKLDPTGSNLLFGTFLGGSADDAAVGMALDRSGNAFLVGNTVSSNFPTTAAPLQKTYGGGNMNGGRAQGDAFLAEISGLGSSATGPVLTGLQNAASYANNVVSPGMIFVVYGSNIGPTTLAGAALTAAGFLSTNISNTQILFDGVAAPIVYVSAVQSSGIVPYEVAGKASVQVTVMSQSQVSAPLTVPVRAAVPGLFSANFSGSGQGAIYNQDNTPNTAANPARRGDIVVLFGTGEGQTQPAGVTGQIATTVFPKPILVPTVSIGGQNAEVLYYGAVPLVVAGEFQINARVPTTVLPGNQPVVVSFGTNPTQVNLTVAVQ